MGPVKAALVARIDAATASDVQVMYGSKVPGPTLGSIVSVGDITFNSEPGTFGDGEPEDESYDVSYVCEVTIPGGTQQQATEAALALHSVVKSSLRPANRDETLGVAGVLWARPTTAGRVVEATDAKTLAAGRSTAVHSAVRVMAVI